METVIPGILALKLAKKRHLVSRHHYHTTHTFLMYQILKDPILCNETKDDRYSGVWQKGNMKTLPPRITSRINNLQGPPPSMAREIREQTGLV
jgi:hypothetical protein